MALILLFFSCNNLATLLCKLKLISVAHCYDAHEGHLKVVEIGIDQMMFR